MNEPVVSFGTMIRQPSAFVPVGMSLIGIALVVAHVAIYGSGREADEGATAHLWQLLMVGQLPVIGYFLIAWLRRAPRQTLEVIAIQCCAALAAIAPVYFWNL